MNLFLSNIFSSTTITGLEEYKVLITNWRFSSGKRNRRFFRNFLFKKDILTYLPAPRIRVILEKLIGFQLVKKFPAFYGTRRFITAATSARHLSLSWASAIQSIPLHPTSWRSILIKTEVQNMACLVTVGLCVCVRGSHKFLTSDLDQKYFQTVV
jgi:hypothetical protein